MIADNVRIGLASIRKSRFRSFLTMLGIIIGVVSVVTIVSLGEGVKRQIADQAEDLGSNLVSVRPGKLINRDNDGSISSVNLFANTGVASLSKSDAKAISNVDDVKAVTVLSSMSGVPRFENRKFDEGTIVVVDKSLTRVIDHQIEFGTFFDNEMMTKRNAIIGPGVAEKLFRETIPIGKSIMIRDKPFTIQGVFSPFEEVPISSGINYNDAVFYT